MRDPRVIAFELKLKKIFDQIDQELEREYGQLYERHPARPRRGETGNPEYDGLFNVGAGFTAGFGSKHGPGYIVEVRLVTLAHVPASVQKKVEKKTVARLRQLLPAAFPNRTLQVDVDGHVMKIHGDLQLGVLPK